MRCLTLRRCAHPFSHSCIKCFLANPTKTEPVKNEKRSHPLATLPTKKKNRSKLLLLPLLGLFIAAVPVRENYFELSKQLEIMNALFRELNIFYVDEIQPGALMETGIDAMVSSLDPYTIYYPESRVEDLRFMSTGEYGGIGASIQMMGGRHLFIDVLPEFPAAEAGIKIGDELTAVDGMRLADVDEDLIPEMLQGASGTEVEVGFIRNATKTEESVVMKRAKIKLPAVPFRTVLRDSTGYVALSAFTRGSSFELRQAIRYLRDSIGMKQLVVDLRGNGGGLLQESISIVNLFIGKGEEVVSTRGKTEEWEKSYSTMADALLPDLPIAVLIDGMSASASEIVAGTLQDLDRAIIVGQESFGKGLVQQSKQLAYGTKLKVTVAKYYTPSGRCIQRLDYGGNRGADGSAQAVADSLIEVFYTRNGRPVVDGKGVQPDVPTLLPPLGYVLEGLYECGTLFDFANAWTSQRDSIAAPEAFALTEADWTEFIDFAEDNAATQYESQTAVMWERLKEVAEDEEVYTLDPDAFEQLEAALKPNIVRDLQEFREQIQMSLEEEIIMRYYLQNGVFHWSLPRDSTVSTAIQTLNSGQYEMILAGTE